MKYQFPKKITDQLAIVAEMQTTYLAARLQKIDLDLPMSKLLRQIADNPNISEGEIAEAINFQPVSISHMVDQLEKRSLVVKVTNLVDQPDVQVSLTADGDIVMKKVTEISSDLTRLISPCVEGEGIVDIYTYFKLLKEQLQVLDIVEDE
ncbi:MarR family winged helix-turn-helix transcriptional regulator [Companilactobacillus versmoldensis]|uniref:MarR family transcriptional regulator n=1 Tax=Companilactobacillus versmoldensis DSM 14857 = KCTC 3814 TaxID=1423815 RepID=A0A0R1SKN2_9LACO|nr:MarR family transcriptional regulator [Companilactobacillus versmoldensis]KRL66837.1 MarR family transcriptional regulator [Companilactobacillus versmoldensis DSM 14857 = KCTC 3814]